MMVQQGLKVVDLALVHGAFRKAHGVDAVDLVTGCDEHPVR